MKKLSAVLLAAVASGPLPAAQSGSLLLAGDDLDGVEMDVLEVGETPADMLNRIELPPPDAARGATKPAPVRSGGKAATPASSDGIGGARDAAPASGSAAAEAAREAASERGRATAESARENRPGPADRPEPPDRPTPPDRPGRP